MRASAALARRRLQSFSRHRRSSVRESGRRRSGKQSPVWRLGDHECQCLRNIAAAKWSDAREHFVEDAAEGPEVAALSAGRPFACSGLMYAAVPRITPICVIAGLVIVGEMVAVEPALPAGLYQLSPTRSPAL